MITLDQFRYKAFISYSHADEKWASWLHKGLETYRVPRPLVGGDSSVGPVPSRLAPVFRDREELASSTDLGADLREALEQSATQIVICSRSSAKSHWVNEEILAFKRLGRSHRVVCLVVDGEPFASEQPGREDEECMPHALRYVMDEHGELTDQRSQHIVADVRPGQDTRANAKLTLVAAMVDLPLRELRREDNLRRNKRMAAVAVFSTAGMVFAIGLATVAVLARNEAERQRVRAEIQAETARQTTSFLVSLFEVSDPGEARGRSITAQEIIAAGVERIDGELDAQPDVQTRLINTVGRVYGNLGLYDDAEALLATSLERRRDLVGFDVEEIGENMLQLADVRARQGDLEEARALYRECLAYLDSSGLGSGELADTARYSLSQLER